MAELQPIVEVPTHQLNEFQLDGVRFRQIPGFSRYYASENGDIATFLMRGNPRRFVDKPRMVKQTTHRITGYKYVHLSSDEKKITNKTVHACVLMAFAGPCPEGMEACHDPDPTRNNNRLSNLRWDTRKSNHADKWKHGTQQAGSQSASAILDELEVERIKHRIVSGDTSVDIARDYGVDETTIGKIRSGDNWATVRPDLNLLFPRAVTGKRFHESIRNLAKSSGLGAGKIQKRLSKGFTLEQSLCPANVKGMRRDKALSVINAWLAERAIHPMDNRRELFKVWK